MIASPCACLPGYSCAPSPNRFRKTLEEKRWQDALNDIEARRLSDAADAAVKNEFGDAYEMTWCQSMQPVVLVKDAA
jgi:hypothetical protein